VQTALAEILWKPVAGYIAEMASRFVYSYWTQVYAVTVFMSLTTLYLVILAGFQMRDLIIWIQSRRLNLSMPSCFFDPIYCFLLIAAWLFSCNYLNGLYLGFSTLCSQSSLSQILSGDSFLNLHVASPLNPRGLFVDSVLSDTESNRTMRLLSADVALYRLVLILPPLDSLQHLFGTKQLLVGEWLSATKKSLIHPWCNWPSLIETVRTTAWTAWAYAAKGQTR